VIVTKLIGKMKNKTQPYTLEEVISAIQEEFSQPHEQEQIKCRIVNELLENAEISLPVHLVYECIDSLMRRKAPEQAMYLARKAELSKEEIKKLCFDPIVGEYPSYWIMDRAERFGLEELAKEYCKKALEDWKANKRHGLPDKYSAIRLGFAKELFPLFEEFSLQNPHYPRDIELAELAQKAGMPDKASYYYMKKSEEELKKGYPLSAADFAVKAGNIDRARELYPNAINQLNRSNPNDCSTAGNIASILGYNEDAKEFYLDASNYWERHECLNDAGEFLEKAGNKNKANTFYKEAMKKSIKSWIYNNPSSNFRELDYAAKLAEKTGEVEKAKKFRYVIKLLEEKQR